MFPKKVKYSTVEKEALGIKYYKYYVLGQKFTLETDEKALQWLEKKDANGGIIRFYLAMQPFRIWDF